MDYFTLNLKLAECVKDFKSKYDNLQVSGPTPANKARGNDIYDFPKILARVIQYRQELEGIEKKDRIEVRAKYSDMRPERDVILWSIVKRKPGAFGKGAPGHSTAYERSFHLRGVFDDPNNPNHRILSFGQRMDNWIELCITSPDANSANRWALEIEELIDETKWFFQYNGFNMILFEERKEDIYYDVGSNPCHQRPLIYYVQTEKIILNRSALLSKVIFETCVQK